MSIKSVVATLALIAGLAAPAAGQVTRIDIESRAPIAPPGDGQPQGAAGPYEMIRGRIHGEVDPRDPHNRIVQDIDLAPRNARGKVEYVASFALARPIDLSKSSG